MWSRNAHALSKHQDLTKLTDEDHCLGRCLSKLTIKKANLCSVIECAVAAACLLRHKYYMYCTCYLMCSEALHV